MEPNTKLTYPVTNDRKGSLFVYGDRNAKRIVIMCPGFPDDHYSLAPMGARLASSEDWLVGIMCLPGYEVGNEEESSCKNGYSFVEWRGAMREAITALRDYSSDKQAKLHGIFHDWGCALGLMYTNQSLKDELDPTMIPERLVLLDVLLGPHPKRAKLFASAGGVPGTSRMNKLYTTCAIVTYQICSACSWWLQRYISGSVATLFFNICMPLAKIFKVFPAAPADWDYLSDIIANPKRVISMSYPYYYTWKAVFTVSLSRTFRFAYLPFDLKRTPILFMFGADKNFNVHNAAGLECLKYESQQDGSHCKVVTVKNAGHWLHRQQEDECLEHVREFLEG